MQRLSSFSHAWTHVVQYRAQSLLPCPFYHKSQSSEASNHKSTDEATIISLFADSASPSSSSRNHLIALVLLVVVLVKDFLDANKAVVSAGRRHLRMTYHGLPQWWSPSNALCQTTTFEILSMSPQWGRNSHSHYLHFFVHKASISKLQFTEGH